jgi:hypothetical protein
VVQSRIGPWNHLAENGPMFNNGNIIMAQSRAGR